MGRFNPLKLFSWATTTVLSESERSLSDFDRLTRGKYLSGGQTRSIHDALSDAFRTKPALAKLVRFNLDEQLDHITPGWAEYFGDYFQPY